MEQQRLFAWSETSGLLDLYVVWGHILLFLPILNSEA
jgi:hypothetical protein